MTKRGTIIQSVKHATQQPYAWPGGYPLYIVMEDGDSLCTSCAKRNLGQIAMATSQQYRNGWTAAGVEVNWEDTHLTCDHCCKPIESAYGTENE